MKEQMWYDLNEPLQEPGKEPLKKPLKEPLKLERVLGTVMGDTCPNHIYQFLFLETLHSTI